jgi:hypothetical protein
MSTDVIAFEANPCYTTGTGCEVMDNHTRTLKDVGIGAMIDENAIDAAAMAVMPMSTFTRGTYVILAGLFRKTLLSEFYCLPTTNGGAVHVSLAKYCI